MEMLSEAPRLCIVFMESLCQDGPLPLVDLFSFDLVLDHRSPTRREALVQFFKSIFKIWRRRKWTHIPLYLDLPSVSSQEFCVPNDETCSLLPKGFGVEATLFLCDGIVHKNVLDTLCIIGPRRLPLNTKETDTTASRVGQFSENHTLLHGSLPTMDLCDAVCNIVLSPDKLRTVHTVIVKVTDAGLLYKNFKTGFYFRLPFTQDTTITVTVY